MEMEHGQRYCFSGHEKKKDEKLRAKKMVEKEKADIAVCDPDVNTGVEINK